jgi:DNA-binding MarR family transcriptional regulator
VPIAGVAFVLSWFLREVPLRTSAGAPTPAGQTLRASASAADIGEAMGGTPTNRTSEQEAERVLSRLSATDLRRFGYAKLARAAGLDLTGGACWILARLAKQGPTPGPELAKQAGVTMDEGHPNAQLLVDRGLMTRTDGVLALTPAGEQTAARIFAAKHDWLQQQLAGWSPEQHAELEHVLTRLSREMLGDEADRRLADR